MNRLTTGAALGAITVYLFDPDHGEKRRRKVRSMWREKGEPAVGAGRAAVASVQPTVRRMTRNIGRGQGWAGVKGAVGRQERRLGAGSVAGAVTAAALGGAAVYFFDPDLGSGRRRRLLSLWREKRQRTLEASQRTASEAAEGVKLATGQAVTTVRNGVRKAQEKLS